jgi:tRNA-dihydrouridine synthase 3
LSGKLFLAPLTTVGNLPFRRLCKSLGADVTCGEMALATNLLQGQPSEWALLKKHPSEDCFGVQLCGGYPDAMARCAQLIEETCTVDFVDLNFGCPIDVVCSKGAGSACLLKPQRMEQIVRTMSTQLSCPLTFKMRKGYNDGQDIAHTLVPKAASWGASAITLHGRTREQRYSKMADWPYIKKCVDAAAGTGIQMVGNGDVFSFEDHYRCARCILKQKGCVKVQLKLPLLQHLQWAAGAAA